MTETTPAPTGTQRNQNLTPSSGFLEEMRIVDRTQAVRSGVGETNLQSPPVVLYALFCSNFLLSANSDISTFSIIALMISIFNIVDLLVSNANNNNNRNNINDNAVNLNDNSNTESNTNPGQSAANQVMMVPPGVGRRKRDIRTNVSVSPQEVIIFIPIIIILKM